MNGATTYQTTRIRTAPRGHLVVILYDIIIRGLSLAVDSLVDHDFETANKSIHKVQNILSELLAHLNIEEGGEVSVNLQRLYVHFKSQLREANRSYDKQKLKKLITQTKQLREAWDDIDKVARQTDRKNFMTNGVMSIMA